MAVQRIANAFRRAKQEGRAAFIAYLTAGYPSLGTTRALVERLAACGVDLIELGIPFSDPLADGPTIQWASAEALRRGVTMRKILDLVRAVRRRCDVPLVAMGYVNPLYQYGLPRFCRDAVEAGFDGVIVPDLPPEEAGDLVRAARSVQLGTIFLAAPTSPVARLRKIAACSTGFIYCVSLTGVTGARHRLPREAADQIRALRKITTLPIAVGFGVSRPEQVRWLSQVADGVIVGSAIVKTITRGIGDPQLVSRVERFMRPLVKAIGRGGAI